MCTSTSPGAGEPHDLLLEIIDALDARGLDSRSYQLHDFVDVDSLERLLATSDGGVEVRFTVKGIDLVVTADDVRVLDEN